MSELRLESPRKRIDRTFEDTSEMFRTVLGFSFLPRIEILQRTDYAKRMKTDGMRHGGDSLAYMNHDDGVLFVDYDSAAATDVSKLIGSTVFYGVLYYAFVNSSEKNRIDFSENEGLKGISFYAQYLLKRALTEKKGYGIDIAEEIRKMDRFIDKYRQTYGWPAKMGKDVAQEKVQDSGQTRMINALILLGSTSDNFGVKMYEMRGMHYGRILREALEKRLIRCKIDESNDLKVMERVKNVYFLVGDERDVRTVMPEVRDIANFLDPSLVEDSNAIINLSDDLDFMTSSAKMKDMPEYEGIIHPILKRATAIHNRPTLINENAEEEKDKKKFAIIE